MTSYMEAWPSWYKVNTPKPQPKRRLGDIPNDILTDEKKESFGDARIGAGDVNILWLQMAQKEESKIII